MSIEALSRATPTPTASIATRWSRGATLTTPTRTLSVSTTTRPKIETDRDPAAVDQRLTAYFETNIVGS